ncbi:Heterokaryon incompatibility protein Het-C domain containing protein [Amanita muscaria]
MIRFTTILILLFLLFPSALAFGAGNIPSFSYVEGKAFRHGDIEDALSELIKHSSSGFALASLISKGSKFSGLDVKRVYFGNWLRDYSQAVDIAGLKKLQLQSIITLCMVLGFLAHGYVTAEFEVTAERLGVYLPVEHIDNPKGYGEGEDPRKYHPKLRGPVDPRELEIDPRTGMKNYIANEQGNWDTSKAHVRRVLQECIRYGRAYRSQNRKEDEYEAFRLLGTALHTLEDFTAHSNFCELALVLMGHTQVFTHVGDNARIQAPNGKRVAPLVTGTFGSSDFTFSLLGGELTNFSFEASVSDLNRQLDTARSRSQGTRGEPGFDSVSTLRSLLTSLPGNTGNSMARDMDNIERIRAGPAQGGKRPEDMDPRELHGALWQVLSFRDSIMKTLSNTIEKIPGLRSLFDKFSDTISVFVLTTIEPFVKPLLKTATQGLSAASAEVISNGDQYQVFNDPRASDPTHSFLSKDHFNLILNEPAGEIARIVVVYAVNLVTKAWDDESANVHQITEDILSCMFHPDFQDRNSKIQREMLQCMHSWVNELGNKRQSIISRLTKDQVRSHRNIRGASEGGPATSQDTFAAAQAHSVQQQISGFAQNIPGAGLASSLLMKNDGSRKDAQYPAAGGSASSYYAGETTSYSSTPSYQTLGYGGSIEPPAQSGYGPSYGPSYSQSYGGPPEPNIPAPLPAGYDTQYKYGSNHEARQQRHEARHEALEERREARHEAHQQRHEARHEAHQQRHEAGHGTRQDNNYDYGVAPGRFPEPGTEGYEQGSASSFPDADPYDNQFQTSSRPPRFPGSQSPADSYSWRD